MGAAFAFAAGSRSLGVGSLAYSDVGSPVQLLIDYEMGGWFRHLLRDVSADPEHEGLQAILATAPRGAYYLESAHTARFYREETWLSGLLDPRAPLAWAANPTDMIERARERVLGMMARAENQCPLSDDKRHAIEELCAEAEGLAATA